MRDTLNDLCFRSAPYVVLSLVVAIGSANWKQFSTLDAIVAGIGLFATYYISAWLIEELVRRVRKP